MDVSTAIKTRRAYRAIESFEVSDELIEDLATHAQLAPSCYNNQPWRFVFVYEPQQLAALKKALSKGNQWAEPASLIIAVASKKDFDCVLPRREYFLFDVGQAVAFLVLRATELNLVAHPIAGFDDEKVKDVLRIPADYTVITLIIVGKRSRDLSRLTDAQRAIEEKRPPRKPLTEFAFSNSFPKK